MLVLAGQDLNREQSITAAALMALYPFSFFALGIYTESLFLLLCLLCMITARRQNWLWAGVWGALAALCRNQGLVLILPLLYLWLRARREKNRGLYPCVSCFRSWVGAAILPSMPAFLAIRLLFSSFRRHRPGTRVLNGSGAT